LGYRPSTDHDWWLFGGLVIVRQQAFLIELLVEVSDWR
jgi:hypothetical protein